MNMVCTSASEVLFNKYEDINERLAKGWAIYGTASFSQTIIVDEGIGTRPVLSGEIIKESDILINTRAYGENKKGYSYTVNTQNLTPDCFSRATKDDLFIFVSIAHPDVLKNEIIEEAVAKRLFEIYQEELKNAGDNKADVKKRQEKELDVFMKIFGAIKNAVKDSGYEIYYGEGHQPE